MSSYPSHSYPFVFWELYNFCPGQGNQIQDKFKTDSSMPFKQSWSETNAMSRCLQFIWKYALECYKDFMKAARRLSLLLMGEMCCFLCYTHWVNLMWLNNQLTHKSITNVIDIYTNVIYCCGMIHGVVTIQYLSFLWNFTNFTETFSLQNKTIILLFLAILVELWLASGREMNDAIGFWPLSGILIILLHMRY